MRSEHAKSGISAFGWGIWLRLLVPSSCSAYFALKSLELLAASVLQPLARNHQSERAVLRREDEESGPRTDLVRKAPEVISKRLRFALTRSSTRGRRPLRSYAFAVGIAPTLKATDPPILTGAYLCIYIFS